MRFWIGAIFMLCAACSPTAPPEIERTESSSIESPDLSAPSQDVASKDEYEVLRTYLDSLRSSKVIFVLDTVALQPDDTALTSDFRTTSQDEFMAHRAALNNLNRVALETKKLDIAFFRDFPFVFASQDEVNKALDESKPGGCCSGIADHTTVTVSQVGIDETNSVAVLYVAHYCGMLCGVGLQIAYKKEQSRWIEMYKRELWVS